MKNRPEKYTVISSKNHRVGICSATVSKIVRPSVPLTVMTEFERKVYKEVAKIPEGKVRSYKYIAEKIGKPAACRAVANALRKNPFIGKVPCHRVIKSDGIIGGFSRGVSTKKKLLRQEGLTIRENNVIIKKRNRNDSRI